MISKIHGISGLGRFLDFRPSPPIRLKRLNLIYAENGLGKSTLTDMFRSLIADENSGLAARKTIGINSQEISLELANGHILEFRSNRWNKGLDRVAIFDERFIDENIYSGLKVDLQHQRKLFPIIVGSSAVSLVEEEQQLKRTIESRNRTIRRLKSRIIAVIPEPNPGLSDNENLDWFLALPPCADIQAKLNRQLQIVSQLDSVERLRASALNELLIPTLPIVDLESLLDTTIDDMADDAVEIVTSHLAKFQSNARLRAWIEEGIHYAADDSDSCPFCGLPLEGSVLVHHYKAAFSLEYKRLKNRIANFPRQLSGIDDATQQNRDFALQNLRQLYQLGPPLSEMDLIEVDFGNMQQTLDGLKSAIGDLLESKSALPLEKVPLPNTARRLINKWVRIVHNLKIYNRQIDRINVATRQLESELHSRDINAQKKKLTDLKATKSRYSAAIAALCDSYSEELLLRESEKAKVRSLQRALKEELSNVFQNYSRDLNSYLRRFGVAYQIRDLAHQSSGGKWKASYYLSMLDEKIPMRATKSHSGLVGPSQALSEGDRRALAFSFFMSSLRASVNPYSSLLVFDDPATSLDDVRKQTVIEGILEVSAQFAQVIVMSHRRDFLNALWKSYQERSFQDDAAALLSIQPQEGLPQYSVIRERQAT